MEGNCGEPSAEVRGRVQAESERQLARWRDLGFLCNAELPERVLRKELNMELDVKPFLAETMKRLRLSGRGFSRALRVARTIADLEGAERVAVPPVVESLSYREGEAFAGMGWRG